MKLDCARAGRVAAVLVACCGAPALAQNSSNDPPPLPPRQVQAPAKPPKPTPRPAPVATPTPFPAQPASPITKPQPRLIIAPGKPWIYTTVPQPLGEVPVSITRAPRPQTQDDATGDRPFRTGGGLGGVKAKIPNVLGRSPSYVPETYGPVSNRRPTPWPCPERPRPRWYQSGRTHSIIGPSGAAYSVDTGGSSVRVDSTSGVSADLDFGNVQVHLGSTPPIYGTYPISVGNGPNVDWNGSCDRWHGHHVDHCRPPSSCWDGGWWTWYDSVGYYGPVYGSGWYQYDPSIFYPDSVTNESAPVQASDVAAVEQADRLVAVATDLLQNGRYDDAIVVLREYTRREPKDAGAWRWLGMALLADRQTKEACYAFLRAYETNESLSDLPLEYEAMGLSKSDLRSMTGPLLTYAKVSKSASAYLLAAVIMDARGLDDQATRLLTEAKSAGLDVMLAQRVQAGFSN